MKGHLDGHIGYNHVEKQHKCKHCEINNTANLKKSKCKANYWDLSKNFVKYELINNLMLNFLPVKTAQELSFNLDSTYQLTNQESSFAL